MRGPAGCTAAGRQAPAALRFVSLPFPSLRRSRREELRNQINQKKGLFMFQSKRRCKVLLDFVPSCEFFFERSVLPAFIDKQRANYVQGSQMWRETTPKAKPTHTTITEQTTTQLRRGSNDFSKQGPSESSLPSSSMTQEQLRLLTMAPRHETARPRLNPQRRLQKGYDVHAPPSLVQEWTGFSPVEMLEARRPKQGNGARRRRRR